eukprot:scaffold950_cov360-Pavlova_lutheri.AAC.46
MLPDRGRVWPHGTRSSLLLGWTCVEALSVPPPVFGIHCHLLSIHPPPRMVDAPLAHPPHWINTFMHMYLFVHSLPSHHLVLHGGSPTPPNPVPFLDRRSHPTETSGDGAVEARRKKRIARVRWARERDEVGWNAQETRRGRGWAVNRVQEDDGETRRAAAAQAPGPLLRFRRQQCRRARVSARRAAGDDEGQATGGNRDGHAPWSTPVRHWRVRARERTCGVPAQQETGRSQRDD